MFLFNLWKVLFQYKNNMQAQQKKNKKEIN